jgi:ArsR family transcriptional regulator, arsenate/arsenite/antimonite-responsive transcriptional repressor
MKTATAEASLIDEEAALMLSALGSLPRLAIYRAVLRSGPQGLNVSELQEVTQIPPSTLKHHLSALIDSGLVEQERRTREVYSTARIQEIRRLSTFLLRECCADVTRLADARAGARRPAC